MKYLSLALVLFVTLALTSCSKVDKEQKYYPPPPAPVQPVVPEVEPVPPPVLPPPLVHSDVWNRGYNDGFNGNWLGPASWLISNEYRAGWSAGSRDMKAGRPNRLN
jgi:hypothetical protein